MAVNFKPLGKYFGIINITNESIPQCLQMGDFYVELKGMAVPKRDEHIVLLPFFNFEEIEGCRSGEWIYDYEYDREKNRAAIFYYKKEGKKFVIHNIKILVFNRKIIGKIVACCLWLIFFVQIMLMILSNKS